MLAADLITDYRAAYFHSFFVLDGFSQFSVSAHSKERLRQQPTPAGLELLNRYGEAELVAEGSGLRNKSTDSGANFSKCPQDVRGLEP